MEKVYVLKCNVPGWEQHREYPTETIGEEWARTMAKNDFFSLLRQFDAKGLECSYKQQEEPFRGTIQACVDGFYYYVELFIKK